MNSPPKNANITNKNNLKFAAFTASATGAGSRCKMQ
jgi:hypothetical protein